MTDKDIMLLAEAEILSKRGDCNFGCIAELVDLADTEEAKKHLHNLAVTMYHEEEYKSGLDKW